MTPKEIVDKIPCACSDCGMRVTETAQLIEEQLKEERNKAIEDCIAHLGNLFPEYGPMKFSILEIRKELSALKK